MIALITFSIATYKARARDLQRVTDLRKINQSLEGYFAANDKYPPTGCGIDGYDCTTIDASAFITSGQVEWAASPITSVDENTSNKAYTAENSYLAHNTVFTTSNSLASL